MSIHDWTCPRCGTENGEGKTAIKCQCGVSRAGWLTGRTEYEYRVALGDGDATVKITPNGITEATCFKPCPACLDSDCGCHEYDTECPNCVHIKRTFDFPNFAITSL